MQDERTGRHFLARPFWRDWVLGGSIVGMGFFLSSPGLPLRGWPGLVVMATGAMIFLAATVHGLLTTFGPRGGRND